MTEFLWGVLFGGGLMFVVMFISFFFTLWLNRRR